MKQNLGPPQLFKLIPAFQCTWLEGLNHILQRDCSLLASYGLINHTKISKGMSWKASMWAVCEIPFWSVKTDGLATSGPKFSLACSAAQTHYSVGQLFLWHSQCHFLAFIQSGSLGMKTEALCINIIGYIKCTNDLFRMHLEVMVAVWLSKFSCKVFWQLESFFFSSSALKL